MIQRSVLQEEIKVLSFDKLITVSEYVWGGKC